MAALTLEQQIAQKEAELARLRERSRALETGQKIIIGGMLIAEARKDARIRKWLLETASKTITRDVDQKRLMPLILELQALPVVAPADGSGVKDAGTPGAS